MSMDENEITTTVEEEKKPARKTRAKPKPTDAASNTSVNVTAPRFLPDQMRAETIERLKGWGFESADTYSDTALMDAQNRYITETREKLITFETHEIGDKLNSYAAGTNLRDKTLIGRLFSMNVPQMYLELFSDRDVSLSDAEIWKIIRFSGIRPVEHIHDIMKARYKARPAPNAAPVDVRYGQRGRR